jgi:AraC-like DNA-binding protein
MVSFDENPRIPFLTLPNWIKAAAHCGFSIDPLLRDQGIETDLIHLETDTVGVQQLLLLMEACVARTHGRHFPFVLGETFAFDYMPDIGTFLSTSASLRESLRVFDWVRAFIHPSLRVHLEEHGDEASLVLEFDGLEGGPSPYFVEAIFASTYKFGRSLLGTHAAFRHLCLRYPAPAYAAEYADYFCIPILFGQPRHTLAFRRELLDVPLGGASPVLHRQAEYRVQRQLTTLPAGAARESGAAALIRQSFADHPRLLRQGIVHLAGALGLHPRTLQRRLREENMRFGELQAQARFRQAADWLGAGDLSIEQISERLGFSDRRSFTRAFTRWSGISPSSFRNKHQKSK